MFSVDVALSINLLFSLTVSFIGFDDFKFVLLCYIVLLVIFGFIDDMLVILWLGDVMFLVCVLEDREPIISFWITPLSDFGEIISSILPVVLYQFSSNLSLCSLSRKREDKNRPLLGFVPNIASYGLCFIPSWHDVFFVN